MRKLSSQRLLHYIIGGIFLILLGISGCSQPGTQGVSVEPGDTRSGLQVHFIDVGQGASQLLIGPTGKTMLIDAGNNDKEQLVVEYIQKEGIKRIDILIGTHPDADHIGGLDAVIDHFDIGQIYMPRIQANTKTFEDVLLAIQRKGLKVTTAQAGVNLVWEDGIQTRMIAPIQEYKDTNEMSAVIHLTYGSTSFLLTGDAEAKSEADMVDSGAKLKADVLLVSHHGSKTSTSQAFLNKVNPAYAVIQVGKNNYGHPDPNIVKRLADKRITTYRNDLHGNIIFTSDGKELAVRLDDWVPGQQKATVTAHEAVTELTATAKISDSKPKQNSSVTITVQVKDQHGQPVPNATAEAQLQYKSTTSYYEATTDPHGIAEITFQIGRASIDHTVEGQITVSYGALRATAKTNFTPQ